MKSGGKLAKQRPREHRMQGTNSIERGFHLLLLLIGEVNLWRCECGRGDKFEVRVAEGEADQLQYTKKRFLSRMERTRRAS